MILSPHRDDVALVPAEVLDLPHVTAFIATLNHEAPGLDLTYDRALVIGYLAVREVLAGRLDSHRALAAQTFDVDDVDVILAASLAYLAPHEPAIDLDAALAEWRASRSAFDSVVAE